MSETFKNTDGRSVVASDTGANIGEIKAFIVDPSATKVEALHIAGKGKKAEVVLWADIKSFGSDAVMVTGEAAVTKSTSDYEAQAVKGKISLLGSRVLTTEGYENGKVEDVEFDAGSGALISVVTDQGTIESSQLRSLGSYALVVNSKA